MTGATTDATDNVSCEVALFRAVIFAMANIATVLANLILVITKRAVESGELAKLISFVVVLTFRSGCCLWRIQSTG